MPAIVISYPNAKDFQRRLFNFGLKLVKLGENARTMKLAVWQAVNKFLEDRVWANFIEHRDSLTLKQSSIEWKQKQVDEDIFQQRIPGGAARPKQALVAEYGRLTDFFQAQIKRTYAVKGGNSLFIRDVSDTPSVSGGAFLWGVNLPAFFRGYPAFILKPSGGPLISLLGDPSALVSLEPTETIEVRDMIFQRYFLPALAQAGFHNSSTTAAGGVA